MDSDQQSIQGVSGKKSFFWGALLVLVALILIGGYFISMRLELFSGTDETNVFIEGRDAFKRGQYGEAIEFFTSSLEKAKTPKGKALSELNLGVALIAGNNPIRGISILKEVSINEEYSDFLRAGAINFILDYYNRDFDHVFARAHIFTGPVWGDFAQTEPSSLSAMRAAYEWSISLHLTYKAAYRVALWHSAFLYNQEALSVTAKQDHINKALEFVALGDLAWENKADSPEESPLSQRGMGRSTRGSVMRDLYRNSVIDDVSEVENSYQEALDLFAMEPSEESRVASLYTSYLYAGFLAVQFGESRAEDVKKLLEPIYFDQNQGSFVDFVRKQADSQLGDIYPYHRAIMIEVAEIDPRFRDYLLRIGWSEEDLELTLATRLEKVSN